MTTYYDVGTGKAYADVPSAVTAIPNDLSATGEHRIRVYAGGTTVGDMYRYDYAGTINLDTKSNESITDFISIYGMLAHNGLRNHGIVLRATSGNPVKVITAGPYSLIRNISLTSSVVDKNVYGIYSQQTGLRVENCLIYGFNLVGGFGGTGIYYFKAGNCYIRNCMIMDLTSTGAFCTGIRLRTGNAYIYNCSVLNITGPAGCFGITVRDVAATITNCIVANAGDCFHKSSGADPNVNNCTSTDITANQWGGDDNQISAIATDLFLNSSSGNENLHLKADSACRGTGLDLSGSFTDDIDGDLRSAWDRGADEYSAICPKMKTFMGDGFDGLAGDVQLAKDSSRFQVFNSDSWVKLPDARTLRKGGEQFTLGQTTGGAFTIKDYDGNTVASPSNGDVIVCNLINNSTAAGVWATFPLALWTP
jgi:hypothetical protein